MAEGLVVALAPERLDEGTPEERAAFGMLTVRLNGLALTEGFDSWINGYRPGPLVSGYHAAEWLAWNWWRLRWEPQSRSAGWWRAHTMTSIGEGYVWPNITIFSDGVRTALISDPSSQPDAKPFRYVGSHPCVIPSSRFEAAVDGFIPQILGRLRDAKITHSNLDKVWKEVLAERADPGVALRRRFEALLGADPDEGNAQAIERLVADAASFSNESMLEIAADHQHGREILNSDTLRQMTRGAGFDVSRDGPRMTFDAMPREQANTPAWLLGARAAQAFRHQLGLGTEPLSDVRLAELAGVSQDALADTSRRGASSFVLDDGANGCRLVLRSKWHTGRRFNLARLLGDRLMNPAGAKLFPATGSRTFRQKAQRSFAGEFLAPFEEINARLDGDYSEENREDVADSFAVSELTVRTLLVNHGRLERQDLEDDFELAGDPREAGFSAAAAG